ncbi:16S rRNA (cytidine(1402)-2'-O)-methyltransferase [Myxococcota bacterium]|nr:16S rRNA (cytidine(1402)-2'-O)-methyltransferase [Myxococcota bacterium]
MNTFGTLYVVATPIGNLGDMTQRAREILATVDVVVAEDTRLTGGLLQKLGIAPRSMEALYKDRERERTEQVLGQLLEGRKVALCSDAGTPGISDPGALLVGRAMEEGVLVVPIPGVSALTALFSVSGFSGTHFWFEGFLPRKGKDRALRLSWLQRLTEPYILYEAPHRIVETLEDLNALDPEGVITVGRELTKLHEEIFHGTIGEALAHFSQGETRGEFVLAVKGTPVEDQLTHLPAMEDEVARLLAIGLSTRDTAAVLAPLYRVPKKQVYELAMGLKQN